MGDNAINSSPMMFGATQYCTTQKYEPEIGS